MPDSIDHYYVNRRNDPSSSWAQVSPNILVPNWVDTSPPSGGADYQAFGVTATGQLISSEIVTVSRLAPGTPIVQRTFGGLSSINGAGFVPKSVATDPSGNIIMSGILSYTVDCGGQQVTSYGAQDMIVAKWSPTGTLAWVKHYGAVSNDVGFGVACNSSGQVFLVGVFSGNQSAGPIDIGTGSPVTGFGQNDAVLIQLSPAGAVIATKVLGGSGGDQALGIAIDSSDNIFICGSYGFFGSGLDLGQVGGPVLPIVGRPDSFVVKLNSSLAYVWSKAVHTTASNDCFALGVSCDNSGNAYVIFKWSGTADFGSGTGLTSPSGSYNCLLAKYSAGSGAWIWQQRIGTQAQAGMFVKGVGASSAGVSITGTWANGAIDFGDGVEVLPRASGAGISTHNIPSMFVAKYTLSGSLVWKYYNGVDDASPPDFLSTTIDSSGQVAAVGLIQTGMQFNGIWYLGNSEQDIMMLKFLSSAGTPNDFGTAQIKWARRGAPGADTAAAVTIAPDGRLVVCGQLGRGLDMGAVTAIPTAGTLNNCFWIIINP